MFQEALSLQVLRLLSNNWENRVISIDLETTVTDRFLHDEYILGIALAVRTSSSLTSFSGIESKVFISEETSENAEIRLLQDVDSWLKQYRPLGIIGYMNRGYDLPLLHLKKEWYKAKFRVKPWKLIDALEQAAHFDLYFILKKKFGIKSLEEAIRYPDFKELPFIQQKDLVSSEFDQKGKDIFNLWMQDREHFIRYIKGDAVNPLLIAEHLIKTSDYNL